MEAKIQAQYPLTKGIFKALMAITVLLMVAGFGTGCSKKKEGSKSNSYRYDRRNAPGSSMIDPQTGRVITSEWGIIYSSGSFNLQSFMPGVSVGYVSANPTDSTGIRFRGRVSAGVFEILVWDDVANQNGRPYFWQMEVAEVRDDGNVHTVYLQDGVGDMALQGERLSNGEWAGNVYYRNVGGSDAWTQLGNFKISQSPTLN